MSKPSPWVMRFLPGITSGGHVLDVACGDGRHLRAALAAGHQVTGVDRDLRGVNDLAGQSGVELIEADLETVGETVGETARKTGGETGGEVRAATGSPPPFAGRQFDGIIVTNYLWRPLLPEIVAAVAPAGLLIYETFALGNERFGKPSNPDFLLRPGELIAATAPSLTVIAFETVTNLTPVPRIVQRIAAVGPEHAWIKAPPTQK